MSFYKLKEHDDKLLARAGTIKAYGHDIDTPINIPTSSDLEKLAELRKSVSHLKNLQFAQPILEVNKFYSERMLKDLEKSPSASERVKNQIEDICSQAKLSMFRPVISREIEISNKLNDTFIEAQIQALTDIILIHDSKFNSSAADFDKRISDSKEYIENHHDKKKYCGVMVAMRMDMPLDLFEQKIRIVDDNGFDGIIFIHTPYYVILKQYLHVQEIAKKKEMFFHLAGCGSTWHVNRKTSMPHLYSLFGFDSASILQPRRFAVKKNDGKKPRKRHIQPKPQFSKFNDESWGLVEPSEWNNCKCPVDSGHKTASSFIEANNGAGLMSSALNYHNLIVGYREFEIGRKFIMHKELKEYMRKKKYAVEAVKKIFKKDLNQML